MSNVTTTAGETFTEEEHKALARLVFKRWGNDLKSAVIAWRRLFQNNCTSEQFAKLLENPPSLWKKNKLPEGRLSIGEVDIAKLDKLQAVENDGRGISCVRSIVAYLHKGDEMGARIIRSVEGDKTRAYPEVEAQLVKMFGCRNHAKHNCTSPFCR